MLLIKTSLRPSKIHNIGLFTDEPLHEGQKVWEFSPGFDLVITKEEFERLPEGVQRQITHYAPTSKVTGNYVFCTDDARFFNHADEPNVTCVIPPNAEHPEALECYTTRKIEAGEELTSDYREYDASL